MKVCAIVGCEKPVDSHGMCGMHAKRVRRYGDPHRGRVDGWRANNRAAQLKRLTGEETAYKKLHGRHEHRRVVEEALGRALSPGEIVHHIDGDKRNNDPSNLQLMTQAEHMALHRREMLVARKAKAGY